MPRWRSALLGPLLAALVACGGAASVATQAIADPTVTARPSGTTPAPAGAPTTAPAATTAVAAATSAAPTATVAPAATRPTGAPSPAGTSAPPPTGPVPAGWTVFRGPAAYPIAIAHPPDWTVDTSYFPAQSVIYLNGPSGEDTVEIVWGARQTEANIDVLRDDFWRQKSEFCDKKGIEYTEHRQLSGVPFAILGASCEQSNDLFYLLVASGLKGGDEWSFVMRTTYGNKDAVGRGIFEPMLASLNVYAPLP